MLRMHFLNVGDGDAILIEDIGQEKTYRLLVDTGRDVIDNGQPSVTCVEHLRALGVDSIDLLIVTHLHIDHFGGLRDLLDCVKIKTVMSGYITPVSHIYIDVIEEDIKTVRGMIAALDRWAEDVGHMRGMGIELREISSTFRMQLTKDLAADIIVPKPTTRLLQKSIWDDLFAGVRAEEEELIYASKQRNPASLRVRLHYRGREVELSGDCLGAEWEHSVVQPCDIFKVPHHGDCKAVTEKLVQRLKPKYAVISCGREYIAAKDRPSEEAIRLLRKQGAKVYFTDIYKARNGSTRKMVDITIGDDGDIKTKYKK